ncbi:4-hydroxy-2-oxovalerate aldolase [Pararhizobium polonicum]|uniref:4-hydroxy-2-oxovalerate aldolase n=1 Tax=Pararhizobium polonicum TaxID=1612624 RepID=A0A1C7P3I7_9HYPH|nr:aldolase/citrate lyase family protein [Pararhizobium polonicum]OBZ95840.1 4-hydroxy-2-oxovalerate aldolase [Pararhizobium polonicum]
MFKPNRLKAQLLAGETVYGCWVGGGSPTNAEILGHIGFDFLLVDHEHGVGESREIMETLRAIQTTPALVRVPWNDHVFLKRVIDAGVQSVMIPSVDTAEAARAAVRACLYPPHGIRGYAAGVVRASTFGLEPDYIHKANGEMLIAVQLESYTAVENAVEIAAVEGADIIFIGVNDLAGSIGRLEQTGHPDVQALVRKAEAAIRASGKIMGTVPNGGASVGQLIERGYRVIAGPHDVALLRDAGLAALADYKALRSKLANGDAVDAGGLTRSY